MFSKEAESCFENDALLSDADSPDGLPGNLAKKTTLMRKLLEVGVFKLGVFTLKSGQISPVYIDMRSLFSAPLVLDTVSEAVAGAIVEKKVKFDYIVGVPHGAVPLTTLLSLHLMTPMLMRRKEVKSYGTRKLVEGSFEPGKRVLVIEDVVTSGSSIHETVTVLRGAGLICQDAVCVLDRQQGGEDYLKMCGVVLHSVITMNEVLDYLIRVKRMTSEEKLYILQQLSLVPQDATDCWQLAKRCGVAKNRITKKVLEIMLKKKTCLCLAVDSTRCEDVLKMVELAGDYVCAVKLHLDIIEDLDEEFGRKLSAAAKKHDFVVFEDRKFADTGNTVILQAKKGWQKLCSISDLADVVTCHALPGQSLLDALRKHTKLTKIDGYLLVAELSTEGALTASEGYVEGVVKLATDNTDMVCGFICQHRCSNDPSFLYWTPGVHMDAKSDRAGQQWRGVGKALIQDKNDIVIVGRAVTDAADPAKMIEQYRKASWQATVEKGAV